MNRHPYGGYDAPPPRRRSASPPYRGAGGGYRGRGRGGPPRGRGGYSGGGDPGYDAYGSNRGQDYYNGGGQAPYPSPPVNGGNDYSYNNSGPGQRDPYYGGGPSGPSEYEDYSYNGDGYGGRGGYEGGGERGGRGRGGAGRGRGGRPREEKLPNSVIEERINRERPCRTLFIRNVKYESNSEDIRAKFAEHGEIKTFFDLIKTRGMIFVTYFDLRAAERARAQLQGMDVSGRPIDVHYSLPREHELSQRCDREKGQGTLLVTLAGSPSRQAIDDNELRRRMSPFGDIKSIKPIFVSGMPRPDQRLVEFFDSRGAAQAHDRMINQPLQDGTMDLEFEWDVPDQPLPPGPVGIPIANNTSRSPIRGGDRGPPYRGGSGGAGAGGRGGGPPGGDWDRGRGPSYHGDFPERRDYPPERDYRDDLRDRGDPRDRRGPGFPPLSPISDRGGPPPFRDYGRDSRDRRDDPRDRGRDFDRDPRGYGPRRGDDWRSRSPPGRGGPPAPGTDEFGRTLLPGREPDRPPYPSYGGPTGGSDVPSEDRLEQAKKVQQLLEQLNPGSAGRPPGGPPLGPQVPPPSAGGPSYYGGPLPSTSYAPPAPYSYNQPPPGPPMGGYGPSSGYMPSGSGPLPPAPGQGGMQSLLALLAQNQSQNPGGPR